MDSLLRQYQEIQKPQPEQAKIYLSGSRDELNGFQLHTRYPEFLQQRSLPKLRNLFSLSLEHSGEFNFFSLRDTSTTLTHVSFAIYFVWGNEQP